MIWQQWFPIYMGDSKEALTPGNDGSLGLYGLYVSVPTREDEWRVHSLLYVDDEEEVPSDPANPDEIDLSKWRGPLKVTNLADLDFIAHAKQDIAALIAEVEQLRLLVAML